MQAVGILNRNWLERQCLVYIHGLLLQNLIYEVYFALGYYFKKRRSYKLQKVHFKFKNWVTTKILLFSSNFNINISFLVAILKLLSNSHSCFRFLNYTWKFYDGVIWFFLMDYWCAFAVIKLWGSEITFWFWFF